MKPPITPAEVLAALTATDGNNTRAAALLGVSRQSVQGIRRRNPAVFARVKRLPHGNPNLSAGGATSKV